MKGKLLFIIFLLFFLICRLSYAGTIWLEEVDGSPSIFVYKILVSNGTLTDNANSTGTIATGGGGSGDSVTVNSTDVDTTANLLDNIYLDFDIADGGAGGPDDITSKFEYAQTLIGNPALAVDECTFFADTSGGGFLCEGSIDDTNEQLYRLPDANGADTTEYLIRADDANVSAAEAGYLDGVTSAIQTQIDGKEDTLTNEAGLYAALSDVTNFLQTGDALAGDDITDGSIDASEIGDGTIDFAEILFSNTLAGNPAMAADECYFFSDTSGGGFICEGSIADTNEQLYRLPDINTESTNYFAMGASDGDALAGDSATSFFDIGTIEHERGGLEADVSAYSGLVKISGGATSSVTDNSTNWNTAYTHSQDNTQAHSDYMLNSGDIATGVYDFGGATSFELPQSATPTTNATGEIALDTTITGHQPLLQYYTGTENFTIIALPTANLGTTDNYIIKYDATSNDFQFEADAGGGDSVSIDSVGVVDPDFVSTGDIDFVDTSNTITANIKSDTIVNADINSTAAIAISKTALIAGTNITLATNTLNIDDAFLVNNASDKMDGTLSLKEQVAADADTAAYGQIWVKTATPNQLWFTDDGGTDVQLGVGGAETNSLETLTTGIASTEIPIGTALDTVVYSSLSGDVSMTNGGVVTVVNDSHTHSAGNITGTDAGTDLTVDLEEEVTEGSLADDTIVEADLKVVNVSADEDILTRETTAGDFEWHTPSELITAGDNISWTGTTLNVTAHTTDTDTNAVKEYWWPAPAMLPLEAADSIPPIAKDAGTNLDQLVRDFDDSTDECVTCQFKVPSDVKSGSTITFRAHWYSGSATTNNVIWDFRHNGGTTEAEDPDAALTTEAAAADAVQGTAGQITVTTWTETLTNLGWAANDDVMGVMCRDANNVSDNFVGDASLIGFAIEIPRS